MVFAKACSSSVTLGFVHLLRDGTSLQQMLKSSSCHASSFLSCIKKQTGMTSASLKFQKHILKYILVVICRSCPVETWYYMVAAGQRKSLLVALDPTPQVELCSGQLELCCHGRILDQGVYKWTVQDKAYQKLTGGD